MPLSVETYIQVFHSLHDFAFLVDHSSKVIDVNSKVRQREFSHTHLFECFDDEGKAHFNKALQNSSQTFRCDFFFSSNDHFFTEVTITPLNTDSLQLFLVVAKDITVQHDKELELLRFSEVIHRTVNPIQITNTEGKIIYVNPAYVAISGYTREELIGMNPNIIKSGKHGKEFWKKVWSKILSGEQWVGQVQNRRKDGQLFHSEVVISPIIAEDKKVIGFLGAHRDITEQKILEQQLVRSQKMETFGTLAAGIAHEVGNPLTSISSLVQILQRSTNDEFFKDKLELVKNQINRITKIIRELVDFSRPSLHIEKDVNVNDVVKEALNIVQYGKKVRNIKFNIQLQSDIPEVSVVADQLVQVFLNILMNAVDACEGENCTISVATRQKGDSVEIIMEDTGTGIAEEQLSKIFDPFFTTKEAGRGTGLGLWVSLGIIKNFDGDIHVESELGQGTTFIVSLPMKGARNG
ncbi:MAG: PAS domain S-box protein [Bacteroidota bacterium]|nr:PAS domain S-box protein [Bacteroidota bacterium]